jgi:hypothetical protein
MLRNGLTSTLDKGHLRAWMNAIYGPIFDGGNMCAGSLKVHLGAAILVAPIVILWV